MNLNLKMISSKTEELAEKLGCNDPCIDNISLFDHVAQTSVAVEVQLSDAHVDVHATKSDFSGRGRESRIFPLWDFSA